MLTLFNAKTKYTGYVTVQSLSHKTSDTQAKSQSTGKAEPN